MEPNFIHVEKYYNVFILAVYLGTSLMKILQLQMLQFMMYDFQYQ